MNLKKIISLSLFAFMGVSMMTSCTAREPFGVEFIETVGSSYSSAVEGSALTIYVDCKVEDSGDGSESAPFKTIGEAQLKLRELKAGEGLPAGGVTVLVRDGEYRLSEPLAFTEEDSGTAECPITYVSENEYGAILSGGLILSAKDFEPVSEEEKARLLSEEAKTKVVKADLKKCGISDTEWGKAYNIGVVIDDSAKRVIDAEIFVNGKRLVSARYPNDDFLRTVKVVDNGDSYYAWSSDEFDKGTGAVHNYNSYDSNPNPRPGSFMIDKASAERISEWSTLEDVCIFAYFKFGWSYSTQFVKDIDVENAIVYNSVSNYHGLSKNAPFYLYNVFDELDNEGEYYIDRENAVLYLYSFDSFDSAEIMMSCGTQPIITASNLSDVTIKGFGACATFSDGFSLSGNGLTVDNCKIYNIKGTGITINGMENTVQNCEILNVGSGGIYASGGDASTLTRGNNLVYNNLIDGFSQVNRVYTPAVSLNGCGNTASNNEMCNSPHEAVSWGGPYQTIEYNEIYDVCLETSDCAAVYGGRNLVSYGCVMRYNYIHDVGNGSVHAHAIYWDDGYSGQTAYGNIIVNTTSYGMLIGGGRDNVIENNVIINSGREPISYDQRARDEMLDPDECWFTHDEEMADALVAMRNDAWIEAFPVYGDIIPWYEGYEGDLDDPNLSGNPANNSVKNNISYYFISETDVSNFTSAKHNISSDVYKFSDITDNPILIDYLGDFPKHLNDDYTMKENPMAKEVCPNFEPIPFDKIGRNK